MSDPPERLDLVDRLDLAKFRQHVTTRFGTMHQMDLHALEELERLYDLELRADEDVKRLWRAMDRKTVHLKRAWAEIRELKGEPPSREVNIVNPPKAWHP